MLKVNDRNTGKKYEIRLKLPTKTEERFGRSIVFIVIIEHISHFFLVNYW